MRNQLMALTLCCFPTVGAAQKAFPSPEAAVQALVASVKSGSPGAVFAIVGDTMRGVFSTGDPRTDTADRRLFLQASRIVKVEADSGNATRRIAYFGETEWPFPAPLVKQGNVWRFDGVAGRAEVLSRRLGSNEIGAIDACRGYVAAQLDYASEDRTGDGMLQFAQKIISTPGSKDGLYWSNADGGDLSPLGPYYAEAAANASAALARGERPEPLSGYYYRILTAQGSHAVGGARNYLVDRHMLGGFALVAWPAQYGVSGISTFMVNQLGVVYERDLGSNTTGVVDALTMFDPGDGWVVAH